MRQAAGGRPVAEEIRIEVVYALAERQDVAQLVLPAGSTLAEAVARSGLRERYPETAGLPAGIFGTARPADTVLTAGDRVELYRPLQADPKQARRLRAGGARKSR